MKSTVTTSGMNPFWQFLGAVWLVAAAIGCTVGDRDKPRASNAAPPPTTTTTQPVSDEESSLDQFVATFPSLPVVDESETTLKAQGIEDLKQTHALLSESIGIEVSQGAFQPLLNAGTIIPAQLTQVVSAAEIGQHEIEFAFYRGTAQQVGENQLIGKVWVVGLPKAESGTTRIELKLLVMRNGNFQLSARELAHGKALKIWHVER
jgi:hypothetical protein